VTSTAQGPRWELEHHAHAPHGRGKLVLELARKEHSLLPPISKDEHRMRWSRAGCLLEQCALRSDLELMRRPDAPRGRLLFDGDAHAVHIQNVIWPRHQAQSHGAQRRRAEARVVRRVDAPSSQPEAATLPRSPHAQSRVSASADEQQNDRQLQQH
jgi:hypothetical protein